MNWLTNFVRPKIRALVGKRDIPENLWQSCPNCEKMIHHKELVENYQNLIRSKKNIQSELSNNQKLAGRINSLNDKLNLLNP